MGTTSRENPSLLHGFIKGVACHTALWVGCVTALAGCAGASPRPPEPLAAPDAPTAAPAPENAPAGHPGGLPPPPDAAAAAPGEPGEGGHVERMTQSMLGHVRGHVGGASSQGVRTARGSPPSPPSTTVAEVILDTPAGRVTVKCPPCPPGEDCGSPVKAGLADLIMEVVKPTAAALGGALAAILVGRRRRKNP